MASLLAGMGGNGMVMELIKQATGNVLSPALLKDMITPSMVNKLLVAWKASAGPPQRLTPQRRSEILARLHNRRQASAAPVLPARRVAPVRWPARRPTPAAPRKPPVAPRKAPVAPRKAPAATRNPPGAPRKAPAAPRKAANPAPSHATAPARRRPAALPVLPVMTPVSSRRKTPSKNNTQWPLGS